MSTLLLSRSVASESLDFLSNACLADVSSLTRTRDVGLLVATFVLAFAIWQIRIQLARVQLSKNDLPMLNEQGCRFFKRRSQRRLQLAILALIVGLAIFVGSSVAPERFPKIWTGAWLCVLFLGIWICVLAVVDAFSTWLSFGVERNQNRAEEILLKYKIEKFKENSLMEQEKTRGKTS